MFLKSHGPKWLGFPGRYIPYPLRATKISIDFNPFGFWLKPDWQYRRYMTAFEKAQGHTIWWARWLWFQVSYSRWV